VNLSSWPEIGTDGDVLLTPCVPKGITGHDDDDEYMFSDCHVQVSLMGYNVLGWDKGRVSFGGRGYRSDLSKLSLNFRRALHYLVQIAVG